MSVKNRFNVFYTLLYTVFCGWDFNNFFILRYLYIKIKTMSKEMRKYIDTFKQRILKENEEFNENDTTEYVDCLDSLKKVNNGIHRQEVILWFNENDIDYFNMTDLDMYIYYIEKNVGR